MINSMKKSAFVPLLLVLGTFLISPLALAQEQTQTYSGFERFIDNARTLFSFGDKKVMLALNIREKELNSALVNTKTGDSEDAEKNLERARKKLLYVQSKVSKNTAGDVRTNTSQVIDKINKKEDLPDDFQKYILEEEKTQFTAALVIEVEGKEGQTLTRELVKDEESGEKKVEIVVEGNLSQTKVSEISEKIVEIDNQITDIVHSNVVEGGKNEVVTPSKTKDNDDVRPAPNKVDNTVDEGPGEPGAIDDD